MPGQASFLAPLRPSRAVPCHASPYSPFRRTGKGGHWKLNYREKCGLQAGFRKKQQENTFVETGAKKTPQERNRRRDGGARRRPHRSELKPPAPPARPVPPVFLRLGTDFGIVGVLWRQCAGKRRRRQGPDLACIRADAVPAAVLDGLHDGPLPRPDELLHFFSRAHFSYVSL